jgi:hypothetical protein
MCCTIDVLRVDSPTLQRRLCHPSACHRTESKQFGVFGPQRLRPTLADWGTAHTYWRQSGRQVRGRRYRSVAVQGGWRRSLTALVIGEGALSDWREQAAATHAEATPQPARICLDTADMRGVRKRVPDSQVCNLRGQMPARMVPGCCLLLRQGCSYDSMPMTLQHPVLLPAAAQSVVRAARQPHECPV